MKLSFLLTEKNLSAEVERVKKLFTGSFKKYLKSRSRTTRLEFIISVIDDIIDDKTDLKLLIIALNKMYSKK